MDAKSLAALVFCGLVTMPPPLVAQQRARHVINGGLPAVSPDGQYIAFFALRDTTQPPSIYIIRPDGSGERKVAAGGGFPQWMPDGKRLLYDAPQGALIAPIDGSGATPFNVPDGRGFAPSPDGKSLVYSAGRPPASVRLMVAAIDGSAPRALTEGPGMAFNGIWSPDGKQIAYARIDSTRDMQIWVVNADGTGARQVSRFSAADGRPQWPSWSSDGRKVAVQSGVYNQQDPSANTAHIWIIDVATGSATKLAAHDRPYLDETPSYFPDGKRIAFQSDRTGRMEIWVMNADGTGARQLTK